MKEIKYINPENPRCHLANFLAEFIGSWEPVAGVIDMLENIKSNYENNMTGDLRLIDMMREKYGHQNIMERKPYKCPVCNGEGGLNWGVSSGIGFDRTCHACEGSGIVWGYLYG